MVCENTARYYDLFHPEKQERIDCVRSILKGYEVTDVLDTYCRTGTVSISLAQEGYVVTSIDQNKEILNFFKSKIRGKRLKIDIKQMGIGEIAHEEEFDAVLSLKTSLNYITNSNSMLEVLKKTRNALRKKGVLILEFTNFLSYLKRFKPEETLFYQREKLNIMRYIKRDVEDVPGILIQNEFGMIGEEGSAHSYYTSSEMKIITFEEGIDLLKDAGFKKVKAYSGYEFEEIDKKAKRFIFVAEKG